VIELLRKTKNDQVIVHACHVLAHTGAVEALPAIKEVAARELDGDLKVTAAASILDLGDPAGFPLLIDVLEREEARLPRADAKRLLKERTGLKTDYDADKEAGENRAAVAKLRTWWSQRGSSLKWRAEARRFE